ncbi:MAG: hypothetical protein HY451_01410, partial [Parcubacteria group bacterium]|nr:hypothetical protein [Parcubacteria group bacterium]
LNRFKKYAVIPAVAFLVLLPMLALAQLPTVSPPIVPGTSLTEVEGIIRRVAQFILVLGVIAALIYIVLGGIAWMRAGGDPTKITTAKTQIWSGVWGALVVIAIGLILQTLAGVVTRVFFQ